MSAFPYFSLAALVFSTLVARVFAASPPSLQLTTMIEGAQMVVTDLRAGKFVCGDSKNWRSAPLNAPLRVAGSLVDHANLLFWKPTYYIARAPVRDTLSPQQRPWFGYVRLVDGDYWKGPDLYQIWDVKTTDPLIAILAWVLDGQIVHTVAKRVPQRSVNEEFRVDHAFPLTEREAAGFGVALLWSKGRFLPPAPTYKPATVEGLFHRMMLGDIAPLESALREARSPLSAGQRDTLLGAASRAGLTPAVSLLLQHGARPAQSEDPPLHLAALVGRSAVVDKLLGTLPEVTNPPPFDLLAFWGHNDIAHTILKRTPATFSISNAMVEEALAHGFTDLAHDLLSRTKLETGRGQPRAYVLVRQIQLGYLAAARFMLDQGIDPNLAVDGRFALGEALRLGETALVEPLLHAGAKPDAVDALNNTPLFYACMGGDIASARRLLAAGANPNFQRRDGQTPLHLAAVQPTADLADLLLAAGADPRAGATRPNPLELALLASTPAAAHALIKAGARIDLEWTHRDRVLAAAVRIDIAPVIADALSRGWKPGGPLASPWDAETMAQLCGAVRCLPLLASARASSDRMPVPAVVPSAELDGPLQLLTLPDVEDFRDGRARTATKPVVVINGIVDDTGVLRCPRIVRSTDGRLSFAALQETKHWRYRPPLKNGIPVCSEVTLLVNFTPPTREVSDLGEVDSPPMIFTYRYPEAGLFDTAKRALPSGASAMARWHEDLRVNLVITTDGRVQGERVLNEMSPHLQKHVIDALHDWRFAPATRAGVPVEASCDFLLEL